MPGAPPPRVLEVLVHGNNLKEVSCTGIAYYATLNNTSNGSKDDTFQNVRAALFKHYTTLHLTKGLLQLIPMS